MHDKIRGENEVKAFAKAMLYNLNLEKNASKGTWLNDNWLLHFFRLKLEVYELLQECYRLERTPNNEVRQKILLEAADIACFAMFVADKLSALDTLEREVPHEVSNTLHTDDHYNC